MSTIGERSLEFTPVPLSGLEFKLVMWLFDNNITSAPTEWPKKLGPWTLVGCTPYGVVTYEHKNCKLKTVDLKDGDLVFNLYHSAGCNDAEWLRSFERNFVIALRRREDLDNKRRNSTSSWVNWSYTKDYEDW